MTLPEFGFEYDPDINSIDKTGITPSGNAVENIPCVHRAKKVNLFFKPLKSELAKYSIAASVRFRMLDKRFAEEIPIFNSKTAIIGLGSIGIPNYLSMREICTKDQEKIADSQTFSCDTAAMVKHNIAPLLVSLYIGKNDDPNPDNLGCIYENKQVKDFAAIDCEEFYFNHTYKIKGKRVIHGKTIPNPPEALKITAKDILEFPCISESRPTHWPTKNPENYSASLLNKAYPNQKEFIALQQDPIFHQQKMAAFLQAVLMYDETVLKNRLLRYYIGDKHFVDNCMLMFHQEQLALYDLLITMPAFREFVCKNAGKLLAEAIRWAKEDNATSKFTEAAKYDLQRTCKRFLHIWRDCYMQQDVLTILDKFDVAVAKEASRLSEKSSDLQRPVTPSILIEDSTPQPSSELLAVSHSPVNNYDLLKPFYGISQAVVNKPIPEKKSPTPLGLAQQEFNKLIREYFDIKHRIISFENHLAFVKRCKEIKKIISDSMIDSRMQLINNINDALSNTETAKNEDQSVSFDHAVKVNIEFSDLEIALEELINNISSANHLLTPYLSGQSKNKSTELTPIIKPNTELTERKESKSASTSIYSFFSNSSQSIYQAASTILAPKQITNEIHPFAKAFNIPLTAWLKKLERKDFAKVMLDIYKQKYAPYFDNIPLLSFLNPQKLMKSHNENEILQLIAYEKEFPTAADLFVAITNNGGWEETSYNTYLLNYLCEDMLVTYRKPLSNSILTAEEIIEYRDLNSLGNEQEPWLKLDTYSRGQLRNLVGNITPSSLKTGLCKTPQS